MPMICLKGYSCVDNVTNCSLLFFYPQFISLSAGLLCAYPMHIASASSSLTVIPNVSSTNAISASLRLALLIPRPVLIPIAALQELG